MRGDDFLLPRRLLRFILRSRGLEFLEKAPQLFQSLKIAQVDRFLNLMTPA
jgi:hypothetical protein